MTAIGCSSPYFLSQSICAGTIVTWLEPAKSANAGTGAVRQHLRWNSVPAEHDKTNSNLTN